MSEEKPRTARAIAMDALRELKPEEWAEKVATLEVEYSPEEIREYMLARIRERVACVIWWDWFSHRESPARWPHLDRYIKMQWSPVPDEIVERALVAMGYSPDWAHKRITEPTQPKKAKEWTEII